MRKNSTARQLKTESSYAKQQRRRAERIIQATGCYSTAFRNEVQEALDRLPHKLPVLFREAKRMDQRLESAGRSIRATLRKAGLPIGEPPKPLSRSPKNVVLREAEEIESVLIQYETGKLNREMADRAELIGDILFDIGNEAGVNATHPQLVRAYYLAIHDALPSLKSRWNYEAAQTAFEQIRDLMNGCSQARFEQIDMIYHGNNEESMKAREQQAGIYEEALQARNEIEAEQRESQKSPTLTDLRNKLARLERVPENEAIAFQLESEIYRLEQEATLNEWPDVIGVKGGAL
jgi:hypothetical protein